KCAPARPPLCCPADDRSCRSSGAKCYELSTNDVHQLSLLMDACALARSHSRQFAHMECQAEYRSTAPVAPRSALSHPQDWVTVSRLPSPCGPMKAFVGGLRCCSAGPLNASSAVQSPMGPWPSTLEWLTGLDTQS